MSIFTANVWGTPVGKGVDLPYIKKAGDTATGLIVFDGGIETNIGTSTFNGPVIFNDDVTLNPSSTLYIDGDVEIAGPSLTITSDITQFNGATTEFNNTDIIIENSPSTIINSEVELTGTSTIKYPDETVQNSAYTGAGDLAGTYTSANINVNADGKIIGLSSGGSTFTSASIFGSGYTAAANYVPAGVATQGFKVSLVTPSLNTIDYIKMIQLRISFNYVRYDGLKPVVFYQTSCDMCMYPSTWRDSPYTTPNNNYQLNNIINTQNAFNVSTSNSYTPRGRQYWTFNQAFSGNSIFSPLGYLVPFQYVLGGPPVEWGIFFTLDPLASSADQFYEGKIEVINQTAANALGGSVTVSAFNA